VTRKKALVTNKGLSVRGYARHCGIAHSYVVRLIQQGKIPVRRDGTIDPEAADRARAENTLLDHRRYAKAPPRPCKACGWMYPPLLAYQDDSPWPLFYCTPECYADKQAGLTAADIARKLELEEEEAEAGLPDSGD
jgi:hypothetical protein